MDPVVWRRALLLGLACLLLPLLLSGPAGTPTLAQADPPAVSRPAAPPSASRGLYKPDDGPLTAVMVENVLLHDPGRNKDLPLFIVYPREGGPYPVIVFSHGAGGAGRGYASLLRYWVSHGYVCLCPTHADSLSLRQGAGNTGGIGNGGLIAVMRQIANDPKGWEARARDASFVIDSLGELGRRTPGLKGKMDPTHLGMGGHSYGAYTTMLLSGATVTMPGNPKPQSFTDSRPQAFLVLSGQGTGQMGLTDHSWDRFTRPTMTMTGSLDRGMAGQGPDWKQEPFLHSPTGDKYNVYIEGANHFSFTGSLAGLGLRGGGSQTVFRIIRSASLAFWDAYLKHDPQAQAYLHSDALGRSTQGAAKLTRK